MSDTQPASPRRRPLLWTLLAALLIASLALAAACGGDDDDNGDGNGNGDATATATPANGDGNGDDDGDDNGDGDGNGGASLDDLRRLGEEYGRIQGRITYDFTTQTEGVTYDGTMTIYSDGDRSRFDYEVPGVGSFITITTPDATYTCTTAGGQGFCFEGEGEDDEGSIPFVEDFADQDELNRQIDSFGKNVSVSRSSETIAGYDAECYTVTGTDDGDDFTSTYCFSDGFMLLTRWSSSNATFEMRATAASGDVSNSDFEPPYDIFDLGNIPGLGDLEDLFGDE